MYPTKRPPGFISDEEVARLDAEKDWSKEPGFISDADLEKLEAGSAKPEGPIDRTWGEVAKDTAIDFVGKGGLNLLESAVGMGNLAAGGASKALETVGLGAIPKAIKDTTGYDAGATTRAIEGWKRDLTGLQSEKTQQALENVSQAKGFWGTLKAYADNPVAAVSTILESAPFALGSMATVRAAATGMIRAAGIDMTTAAGKQAASAMMKDPAVLSKLMKIGAVAEGAMTAGSNMAQARGEGATYEQAALPSLVAGAITGAIGYGSGKIPGFRDVDVAAATAGLREVERKGLFEAGKKIAKDTFKEGVLEELPQSAQEQFFANIAAGKPQDRWMEGVKEAGAAGMVAGAGQGGAMSVFSAAAEKTLPKKPEEAVPQSRFQTPPATGAAVSAKDALAVDPENLPQIEGEDYSGTGWAESGGPMKPVALAGSVEPAKPITQTGGAGTNPAALQNAVNEAVKETLQGPPPPPKSQAEIDAEAVEREQAAKVGARQEVANIDAQRDEQKLQHQQALLDILRQKAELQAAADRQKAENQAASATTGSQQSDADLKDLANKHAKAQLAEDQAALREGREPVKIPMPDVLKNAMQDPNDDRVPTPKAIREEAEKAKNVTPEAPPAPIAPEPTPTPAPAPAAPPVAPPAPVATAPVEDVPRKPGVDEAFYKNRTVPPSDPKGLTAKSDYNPDYWQSVFNGMNARTPGSRVWEAAKQAAANGIIPQELADRIGESWHSTNAMKQEGDMSPKERVAALKKAVLDKRMADAQARLAQTNKELAESGVNPETLEPTPEKARREVPRVVADSKPRYKTSRVSFEDEVDKALYITAQPLKSKADPSVRKWLKQIGMTDAEIDARGKEVKQRVKEAGQAVAEGNDIRIAAAPAQAPEQRKAVEFDEPTVSEHKISLGQPTRAGNGRQIGNFGNTGLTKEQRAEQKRQVEWIKEKPATAQKAATPSLQTVADARAELEQIKLKGATPNKSAVSALAQRLEKEGIISEDESYSVQTAQDGHEAAYVLREAMNANQNVLEREAGVAETKFAAADRTTAGERGTREALPDRTTTSSEPVSGTEGRRTVSEEKVLLERAKGNIYKTLNQTMQQFPSRAKKIREKLARVKDLKVVENYKPNNLQAPVAAIARSIGIRIVWVEENKFANGFFDESAPETIFISVKSPFAAGQIIMHEIKHSMDFTGRTNEEVRAVVREVNDAILNSIKGGEAHFQEWLKVYAADWETTPENINRDVALEEDLAEFFQDAAHEQSFWARLYHVNRRVYEAAVRTLRSIVQALYQTQYGASLLDAFLNAETINTLMDEETKGQIHPETAAIQFQAIADAISRMADLHAQGRAGSIIEEKTQFPESVSLHGLPRTRFGIHEIGATYRRSLNALARALGSTDANATKEQRKAAKQGAREIVDRLWQHADFKDLVEHLTDNREFYPEMQESGLPKNSDPTYLVTVDLPAACIRMLQSLAIRREAKAALGRDADQNTLAAVEFEMKRRGHLATCIYCYAFTRKITALAKLQSVEDALTSGDFNDIGLKSKDADKVADWQEKFKAAVAEARDNPGWQQELDKIPEVMRIKRVEGSEMELLSKATKDFDNKYPAIRALLQIATDPGNMKLNTEPVAITDQILKLSPDKREWLNNYGGLRWQSSIDFAPEMALDYIFGLWQMSLTNQPGHVYTKEIDLIRLWRDSGMKNNLSAAPLLVKGQTQWEKGPDGEMRPVMDVGIGAMSWDAIEEAFKIDPNHTGVMMLAPSDDVVKWITNSNSKYANYGILWHASGMPKRIGEIFKKIVGAKNYEDPHEVMGTYPTKEDAPERLRDILVSANDKEGKFRGYVIDLRRVGEVFPQYEGVSKTYKQMKDADYKKVINGGKPVLPTGAIIDQATGVSDEVATRQYLQMLDDLDIKPIFNKSLKLQGTEHILKEHPKFWRLKKHYARTDTPMVAPDWQKIDMKFAKSLAQQFESGPVGKAIQNGSSTLLDAYQNRELTDKERNDLKDVVAKIKAAEKNGQEPLRSVMGEGGSRLAAADRTVASERKGKTPVAQVDEEGGVVLDNKTGVVYVGADLIHVDMKGRPSPQGIDYPNHTGAFTVGEATAKNVQRHIDAGYTTIVVVGYKNLQSSMNANPLYHAAIGRALRLEYGKAKTDEVYMEAQRQYDKDFAAYERGDRKSEPRSVDHIALGILKPREGKAFLEKVAQDVAVPGWEKLLGKAVGVGEYASITKAEGKNLYPYEIKFKKYYKFKNPVDFSAMVDESGKSELHKNSRWLMLRSGNFAMTQQDHPFIPTLIKAGEGKVSLAKAERTTADERLAGKPAGEFYVDATTLNNGLSSATQEQQDAFNAAREKVPADYQYDIVAIDRSGKVRFLKLDSLKVPHPRVKDTFVVNADGTVGKGVIGGAIYHRMETILSPNHPMQNYYQQVTALEEEMGALGPFPGMDKAGLRKTPSGSLATWKQQLASKGIDYGELERRLAEIKPVASNQAELDYAAKKGAETKDDAAGLTARPWKMTTTYRAALDKVIKSGDRVIDYGSGPYQNVKPHIEGMGATYTPFDRYGGIGSVADLKNADVVMGSNVLNTAVYAENPEQAYNSALNEMADAMKGTATLVVNMPTSGPRALWMTPARLEKDLKRMFTNVTRNGEVVTAQGRRYNFERNGMNIPVRFMVRAGHASRHFIANKKAMTRQKRGTGQGAASYGDGLYFWTNPAVGKQYFDEFMTETLTFDGQPLYYSNGDAVTLWNKREREDADLFDVPDMKPIDMIYDALVEGLDVVPHVLNEYRRWNETALSRSSEWVSDIESDPEYQRLKAAWEGRVRKRNDLNKQYQNSQNGVTNRDVVAAAREREAAREAMDTYQIAQAQAEYEAQADRVGDTARRDAWKRISQMRTVAKEALELARKTNITRGAGQYQNEFIAYQYMAELDFNDEDLLDWDLPYDQQPRKVREILDKVKADVIHEITKNDILGNYTLTWEDRRSGWETNKDFATEKEAKDYVKYVLNNWGKREAQNMGAAYKQLAGYLGSQAAASDLLLAHGIPGIRYADAGSRTQYKQVDFDRVRKRIADLETQRQRVADAKTSEPTEEWLNETDAMLKIVGAPFTEEDKRVDLARLDRFISVAQRELKEMEAKANPTFNYVVFDDSKITLTSRSREVTGTQGETMLATAGRTTRGGAPKIQSIWDMPVEGRLTEKIRNYQNRFVDVKDLTRAIESVVGTIPEEANIDKQQKTYLSRLRDALRQAEEYGWKPILEYMGSKKMTLDEAGKYLVMRRVPEYNAIIKARNPALQGPGSGITDKEAADYMRTLSPTRRAELDKMANMVDAFRKETHQLMISYGLEKKEVIDAWEKMHPSHISFERTDINGKSLDDYGFGGDGTGQGFNVAGSMAKIAHGSMLPINPADSFASLIATRERTLKRGIKNVTVGHATYAAAMQYPNTNFWRAIRPSDVYDKAGLANLKIELEKALGIAPALVDQLFSEPTKAFYNSRTKLTEYRVNEAARSSDNVFVTRINGEDHYVFFNARDDRALATVRALKNRDIDPMTDELAMAARFTRYYASVSTQWNPFFGIKNMGRDMLEAGITLQGTPLAGRQLTLWKYAFQSVPALWNVERSLRGNQQINMHNPLTAKYQQYKKAGGPTGHLDYFDGNRERAEGLAKELEFLTGEGKKIHAPKWAGGKQIGTLPQGAWQAGRYVKGWIEDMNTAMENATRFAAFRIAVDEMGMSETDAAIIAKELTVNFNDKGRKSANLNALVAFANAAIQGTATVSRTMFDTKIVKDPVTGKSKNVSSLSSIGKQIIAGGFMLGVMQALILGMAGARDNDPPEWDKDNNFYIPNGTAHPFKIPTPLGFNFLINMGRRSMEMVMTGGDDGVRKMGSLLAMIINSHNPLGDIQNPTLMITPTALKGAVSAGMNKDWKNMPIYREDYNQLDPTPGYERARETATWTSRQMALILDHLTGGDGKGRVGFLSPTPDMIDFLTASVFGGLGRESLKVGTTMTMLGEGEEIPAYKIPLVSTYFGQRGGSSYERTRYYDNVKEAHQNQNAIQKIQEAGGDVQKYFEERPEARLSKMTIAIENKIKQLHALRVKAKERGDGDTAKRLDDAMKNMMVRVNEAIAEVKQ